MADLIKPGYDGIDILAAAYTVYIQCIGATATEAARRAAGGPDELSIANLTTSHPDVLMNWVHSLNPLP
jgi:hypothetical protein